MRVLPPERIPLIDREEEVRRIREHLEALVGGRGGALFVEGEVGVGKTRILKEVFRTAPSGVRRVFLTVTRIEDPLRTLLDAFLYSITDRAEERHPLVAREGFDVEGYMVRFRREGGVVVEVGMEEGAEKMFCLRVFTEGVETTPARSPEELGTLLMHLLRYNRGNVLIVWKEIRKAAEVFPREKLKRLIQRIHREARESGSLLILRDSPQTVKGLGAEGCRTIGVEVPGESLARRGGEVISPLFVATVLKGAAKREPLLLVLEDLHLSTRAFMNTLHFLMRELKDHPIFFLGSYRVEEGMPAGSREVVDILKRASRERLFDKISIRSFDRRVFRQYVEALQPERTLDEEEIEVLYRLSGGNPLLTWEILGYLPPSKSVQELESEGLETVPAGLKVMFMKGQTLLTEEEKRLMGALAVLGESVTGETLVEVFGGEGEEVFDLIERLMSKGYLKEEPDGKVGFVHEVFRENTYETLDKETLKDLHRRVAYHYLRMRERIGSGFEKRIVYHLREGGEREYALYFSLRVARRFLKRNEVEAGIEILRTAMDTSPEELSRGLWLKGALLLAEGLLKRGDFAEAEQWVERATEVAREMGWEEGVRRGEELRAILLKEYGRYDEALHLLVKNLRALDELGERGEEAWNLYYNIGELLFYQGEVKRAREMLENYLQNSPHITRERVEAHLIMAEIERLTTGEVKGVERHLKAAKECSRKLGDPALLHRMEAREIRERIRLQRSGRVYKEKLRNLVDKKDWVGRGTALLDLVECAILLKEHRMAEDLLSLARPQKGEEKLRCGILTVQLYLETGRVKELEGAAEELEKALEEIRIPLLQGSGYAVLSQAFSLLGRKKESERAERKAMEHLRRLQRNLSTT
ncbi:MAG TPA: hypothetical protein ENF69_01670 [Euryarchaeota archaeon]|nr:hypothetical protein [Euryarchaeota archaeon]